MVTIQEVEQREEELKDVEKEAQQYVRETIPQRRFGSRVTREQQQAVISRRQQAQFNLAQVKQQRESLKQTRADIKVYNQQQSQLNQLKAQEQQYKYGYNLGLKGVVDPSFSQTAKQGFRDARGQLEASTQRVQRIEQIRKLEREGIKPILDDKGVIVGIEDKKLQQSMAVTTKNIQRLPPSEIERYKRAGLIKVTQQPGEKTQLTPKEKLDAIVISKVYERRQSIAPKEPFFGKVERVVQYPFKKVAYYETRYQKAVLPKGYSSGFGVITPTKPGEKPVNVGAKGFKFVGEAVSFPVYGAKQIELYATNKQFRESFQRQTNFEKSKQVLAVELSVLSAGLLGRSAVRYAKQPIKVYETPKFPTKFYSQSQIKNLRVGGKAVSVGSFEVTAVTLPRQALYIPRYSKVLSGIKRGDLRLKRYSPPQLDLMFPRGKFVEIQPLRITKSTTEPFIIQRGKILTALGRKGSPSVLTGRASLYKSGKTRFTSRKISSLYGETYGSKTLNVLDDAQGLSDIQKLALQRVKETNLKGIEALPKGSKAQFSAIETKDLLKIQARGLKAPKPGKTINRGEIVSVQKELLSIQKGTSKYGLKEQQVIGERLGVIDTTFPRVRPPKKSTKIEGRTTIKEYDLPDLRPSDVKVFGPGSQKTKLKFDNELNQKAIQEAVGSVAVSQPKTPSSVIKSTAPKVESTQVSTSPFAGTGLYERTDLQAQRLPGVQKFSVQAPGLTPKVSPGVSLKPIQIPKVTPITRQTPKAITRQVPKEVSLNLPRSITRLQPKTITKQTPKIVPKQIVRQTPKITPKITPGLTPIRPTPGTGVPPPVAFPRFPKGMNVQSQKVPGFRPFVIRGGQKKYLGGALPKGQALSKAEKKALGGLGATFGVEPTKTLVPNGNLGGYTPSKSVFRSYRIVQGKKVPLQDTFIQKKGKRLLSGGEIKEIQTARRFKI